LVLVTAAVLAAAAWFAPRAARTVVAWHRRRREAWLQSEAWSFHQLRRAAGRRDAKATYFALLDWLQRFAPISPEHNVKALKAAAGDPALDRHIDSLERQLFAPDRGSDRWSQGQLLRRVSAARTSLRRQAARTERARPLPQQINPICDGIEP